jgi:putative (di)nucleoside polyphosphate hydrolase
VLAAAVSGWVAQYEIDIPATRLTEGVSSVNRRGMNDPRSFRPNVGAILRRPDGRILMCERIGQPGAWQFPQGGVERREDRLEALWREIEEELGLVPAQDFCVVAGVGPEVCYEFPPGVREKIARKYRGQAQVLYLLDYSGSDSDFDLERDEHPEFQAVRWVTVEESVALMWEMKRPVLEATIEALGL